MSRARSSPARPESRRSARRSDRVLAENAEPVIPGGVPSPHLSVCAVPIVLVACGPVQSATILVDAQAELAAAETLDAKSHAPFEFVAAEEYLHKAREEQSYAEYETAVGFARKARDCARLARLLAEAKTRDKSGTERPRPAGAPSCRPGPDRRAKSSRSALEVPPPREKTEPLRPQPTPEREPADPGPAPGVVPAKPTSGGRVPVKVKEEPLPEGDSDGAPASRDEGDDPSR